jgi:hypothetical protein
MGAAAGLGLVPGAVVAQQKSIKEHIVGTWLLGSWVQTRADGSKNYRFGDNPKGINTFSADGHFSLAQMRGDLPKISSVDPLKPTPEEAVAIVQGSIAYFGTYTVDEASRTLNVELAGTTLVNQLGTVQKRTIDSIDADEMRYRNANSVGNLGKIELVWKRA